LDYIKIRLTSSEEEMGKFYARWNVNEKKIQGYIAHGAYEKQLKALNEKGEPPKALQINVPYSFAAISTIVTFQLHTLTARKPILAVGTYKDETVESARFMETVLQFNADHTRLVRELFQFLQDAQVYGVGIMRTNWRETMAMRTVWREAGGLVLPGVGRVGGSKERTRENRLVYQGNEAMAQDPFMFFPDPRVPMCDVNKRGEFVFWREYEGKHRLKLQEAAGEFKYIDNISASLPRNATSGSVRGLLAGGEATPGASINVPKQFIQIDQGTMEIIPRELGLGQSETPEKWIFAMGNKNQIIQAEPFIVDHSMHPVVVTEPYTMGYGLGQMGVADYLAPLQDTISWFINSHIDNVRRVLNDMIVYDPSMIEKQDLKRPGPGKLIRLKRAAFGQDVRTAVSQLNIQDVTSGHTKDAETFFRIGEILTSASQNLMGRQDTGGRKTATESRTSAESAASRLSAGAKLISAQAIVDLAEQWSVNTQQFQSEEFYLAIVGQEGLNNPVHITPEMVVGDFHYPVHDGTLPVDKVALLDVWRQIFSAVQADPELRQQYSISKVFEYIAELGGAKNIEAMRLNAVPDQQIAQQAQAGNAVPVGEAVQGLRQGNAGNINATPPRPGDRAAERVGP
jgi:hypothetical protein